MTKDKPTEICSQEHCNGNCLRKRTVVPQYLDSYQKKVAAEAEYWVCLKCGKEHQTKAQQLKYMQRLLETIPEEVLFPRDKDMLAFIKVKLGEESVKEEKV